MTTEADSSIVLANDYLVTCKANTGETKLGQDALARGYRLAYSEAKLLPPDALIAIIVTEELPPSLAKTRIWEVTTHFLHRKDKTTYGPVSNRLMTEGGRLVRERIVLLSPSRYSISRDGR